MPKARRDDGPLALEGAIPLSDGEAEAMDAVENVLGEIGDKDAKVKVYRRDDKGKLHYTTTLNVTGDFDEETVREHCGGGQFCLRFRVAGQLYKTVTIYIEGPSRVPGETLAAPNGTAPAPVRGALDPQLVALELKLAALTGMMQGMAQGQKAAGPAMDPLAMLDHVMGLVRANAPVGTQDPIAQANQWLEFAERVGGKGAAGEDGFPWSRMFDATEKLVGVALEERMAQTGRPPALPAGSAPPAGAAAPARPAWWTLVKGEIPAVLAHARDGDDAGLWAGVYAEQLARRVPAVVWGQIVERAERPGFVDETWGIAVANFPELAPAEGWVKEGLTAFRDDVVGGEEEPAA